MSRTQFLEIMLYLSAGCGKEIPREMANVYFDLLGDLPAEALGAAVQRALLESKYPTVPPVGVLRQLAVEALRGQNGLPSPMEAWRLVWMAIDKFGYYREQAGLNSLPAVVRRAAECLGWQAMCDATEEGILRAQFCKAYEQVVGRAQREALLPPKLVALLEKIGKPVNEAIEDNRRRDQRAELKAPEIRDRLAKDFAVR